MPEPIVKGILERSAKSSLFRYTLSKIPTAYGRLAYLASLRDPNSGKYRHHGLFSTFGRKEGTEALELCHFEEFQFWNLLPLETKHGDLKEFLESLEDTEKEVLKHWIQTRVFRSYVPAQASEAEKDLFAAEIETLLSVLLAG